MKWYMANFGNLEEEVVFRFKEKSNEHAIHRAMGIRDRRFPKLDLVQVSSHGSEKPRRSFVGPMTVDGEIIWDWINGAI